MTPAISGEEYGAVSYAVLALILILFPLVSVMNASRPRGRVTRLGVYFSTVVTQWMLLGIVMLALSHEGEGFGDIGWRATMRWPELALVALALVAFGALLSAIAEFLRQAGRLPPPPMIRVLMPGSAFERAVFLFLLIPTAAVVEEVVFRGFAITRLAALVQDPLLAAAIAAFAFAMGHIYQRWTGLLLTAAMGFVFGAVFLATGSLFPLVIAHGVLNVLGRRAQAQGRTAPVAA